jgi:KAP family P-loop domain
MEILNLNNDVSICFEKAKYLNKLRGDERFLYEELNKLPKTVLKKIQQKYSAETGPINTLRLKVCELILRDSKINREIIDELRNNTISDKDVFRAFRTPFSLFYTFFLESISLDEKALLRNISNILISKLNLTNINVKIVDFNGSMNYGNDWIWFAIYNSSHPDQKTAKQLFFSLGSTGIIASLYDRPNDIHYSDSNELEPFLSSYINKKTNEPKSFSPTEFDIDDLIRFFDTFKQSIINDIYNQNLTKNIEPLTPDIYKISHGNGVISDHHYNLLLEAQLVIVHEDTNAMGTSGLTQFVAFENAKIGDLFYLCRSNQKIELIGKFTSYCEPCKIEGIGVGWQQRNYELIAEATKNNGYSGKEKSWWLPNFNSTFYRIPKDSYRKAENELFLKCFNLKINDLVNSNLIKIDQTSKQKTNDSKLVNSINEKIINFSIKDSNANPILDIKNSILPFAQIIKSLEVSEPGQMLGIFGSWGRGKTYFVKHLCEHLKIDFQNGSDNESEFHFVKFHAWKYQDTKAVWAYLYDVIADKYYTHSNYVPENRLSTFFANIANSAIEYWKRFLLNLARNGYSQLYLLFLSFLSIILLIFNIIPISWFKIDDWKAYAGSFLIGFPFANVFYKMYRIGSFSKQIVKRYTERPTFNQLLGVQAEIQNELIALLTTWIKDDVVAKKRILLFVDDLDRCDADQIIRVIDALRVMLEDPKISERLIVLTAVDENILKGAITCKYDIIRDTLNKESIKDEKPFNMSATVHQYIDKLFISGIRLHPLTNEEKSEVLKNYADQHKLIILDEEKNNKSVKLEDLISRTNFQDEGFKQRIDEEYRRINEGELLNLQQIKLEGTDEINSKELDWINEALVKQDKCTPRQIRIIMYRYFLAKAITQRQMAYKSINDEFYKYIAHEITYKTFGSDIMTESFTFNDKDLQNFAPKIIQMVVPY